VVEDDTVTIGWVKRFFGRVVHCVRCDRLISEGIVNKNDRSDPPSRAMCRDCYQDVVTTGPA
jgi:hypothetical protein